MSFCFSKMDWLLFKFLFIRTFILIFIFTYSFFINNILLSIFQCKFLSFILLLFRSSSCWWNTLFAACNRSSFTVCELFFFNRGMTQSRWPLRISSASFMQFLQVIPFFFAELRLYFLDYLRQRDLGLALTLEILYKVSIAA